jgi:Putative TM nitroreductase
MLFQKPSTELISNRYSCRSYRRTQISAETRLRLQVFLADLQTGPLGTPLRFKLIAASEDDHRALRGLGTYGFIRGATGFIAGAAGPDEKNMEDFGYQMEAAILAATDLGLGSCWLGGSFTQSGFARRIARAGDEIVPAVTAVGYAAEGSLYTNLSRRQVHADRRLPWESLFFEMRPGTPLGAEAAGSYALPLEMVRLAPSASNKQPWRIAKDGGAWHFYLRRTPNYGPGSLVFNLMGLADLQRVDIGIAMCHFELTARELGLAGCWAEIPPGLETSPDHAEYVVSWVESDKMGYN